MSNLFQNNIELFLFYICFFIIIIMYYSNINNKKHQIILHIYYID